MSATRFIIRLQNRPLRFPKKGVPVLYEVVPTDQDATGFETRDAAVQELVRRKMGHRGISLIEVPLEGLKITPEGGSK